MARVKEYVVDGLGSVILEELNLSQQNQPNQVTNPSIINSSNSRVDNLVSEEANEVRGSFQNNRSNNDLNNSSRRARVPRNNSSSNNNRNGSSNARSNNNDSRNNSGLHLHFATTNTLNNQVNSDRSSSNSSNSGFRLRFGRENNIETNNVDSLNLRFANNKGFAAIDYLLTPVAAGIGFYELKNSFDHQSLYNSLSNYSADFLSHYYSLKKALSNDQASKKDFLTNSFLLKNDLQRLIFYSGNDPVLRKDYLTISSLEEKVLASKAYPFSQELKSVVSSVTNSVVKKSSHHQLMAYGHLLLGSLFLFFCYDRIKKFFSKDPYSF